MNKERKEEAGNLAKLMLEVASLQTNMVRAGYNGLPDYEIVQAELQNRYHRLTGEYFHIQRADDSLPETGRKDL